MHKKLLLASLATLSGAAFAEPLSSGDFTADVNPAFPGLFSYSLAGNSMALPKNAKPVVLINGTEYTPAVKFIKTAADAADYQLDFPDLAVTMTATVTMSPNTLSFTITSVRETGAFAVRTIEIPGLLMLAGAGQDEVALGNFPAGSYASEKPEDHDLFGKVADLPAIGEKDKNKDATGNRGASYAFISNGKIAAGMYANVMDENLRMIVRPAPAADPQAKVVSPGKWTWREIPTEICPAPQARLFVAGDENGDGKITWQDAAIVYRKNTPAPYGADKTKNYPITYIAMNFGSQATNPFLRVLDNSKKIWLYTDGLGQRVQQKGFAGEGHDSSHPDYAGNVGRRMGGRDDLNFVMRRGHDFNILTGIHINAHEYHKEAKSFNPDIANLNAVGWSWLDESYLTDYRYDSAYGTLYQRLEAMRADLPWLDFIYLDVYYGRGWPGWRMHTKVNALGILQFTEFPGIMERGVVWNHVANDWTQSIWGKGDRSAIARFIYYSQKDTFKHDPLLRGSNCDGFMGWHAERNMLQTIASAFTVNLPTKYLQHFQLVRQEATQACSTMASAPRSMARSRGFTAVMAS
jgi:endo-alpha-N-acetylgalactosaminidase